MYILYVYIYKALCLRVTAMVCFICIVIILPLNLTAHEGDGVGNVTLTNYGRTTIANIFNNNNITDPALLRLYVIAFCTWYITYFALRNIERDWKENLVLRRVYYLESDHYGSRQIELTKTLYNPLVDDDEEEEEEEGEEDDGGGNAGAASSLQSMKNKKWEDVDPKKKNTKDKKKKSKKKKHRNPWIPNPEQRDTVPSIELYSVLVGGLPSLPDEVLNSKVDMQAALGISNRVNIDWQLAVATTFFDHCVPNQPGFSSSIVAVTILPGAPELAKAWRKWYAAAAALRRLRFIRSVIRDKVRREREIHTMHFVHEHKVICFVKCVGEYHASNILSPTSVLLYLKNSGITRLMILKRKKLAVGVEGSVNLKMKKRNITHMAMAHRVRMMYSHREGLPLPMIATEMGMRTTRRPQQLPDEKPRISTITFSGH